MHMTCKWRQSLFSTIDTWQTQISIVIVPLWYFLYFQRAKIGLNDEQIQILLNKMDKDHDGEIDFG